MKDFYPGGSIMPGRSFNSTEYRYKHQGQESDPEIYGEGNSYAYRFRMSDPRLNRFWSVDPLAPSYPGNSPYAFAQNRLIDGTELEGLEWQPVNGAGENVATDADNIQDYKWTGYKDQVPYKPNTVPKDGTVAQAQINYWDNGLEISDYFGVGKGNTPLTESYVRAPWMGVIGGQVGLAEDKSSASNPTIQGMIDANNADFGYADKKLKPIYNDNNPWCGV
ncbi:MAG: hypothetical protein JKY53_03475 [Flavobacteriales bacterium]|nr:hypothetical protein [Flavobacteriales bacterium]